VILRRAAGFGSGAVGLPVAVVVDAVADFFIVSGDGVALKLTRESVAMLRLPGAFQRIAVVLEVAGSFVGDDQQDIGPPVPAATVVGHILIAGAALAGSIRVADERRLVPGRDVHLIAVLPADVVFVGVPVTVVVQLIACLVRVGIDGWIVVVAVLRHREPVVVFVLGLVHAAPVDAGLPGITDDSFAGIRRNPVLANPLDANQRARTVDIVGAARPAVALAICQ
jgi:hypothetical protein